MGSERVSRQHGHSVETSGARGGHAAAPGKQTLVEQAYGSDLAGLRRNAPPDEDVGGRTVGEAIGDAARPVVTAAENAVGRAVGRLTGITISSHTTSPAAWSPHGFFHWEVAFNTTGRSGWLVQEVRSTRRAQDASGKKLPDHLTPHYWEAWGVDAAGAITPQSGATHDFWQRRSFGNHTQGHWTMTSAVHFTTTHPASMGFTPGGVPEAGSLLSTTSAPSGLGVARLHRYAQGTWDSTGAKPTHTGSAGP